MGCGDPMGNMETYGVWGPHMGTWGPMGCGDPIWGHGDLWGVGTYGVWGPIGWGDPIGEHGDLWGVGTPFGDMGTSGVWGSHMGCGDL